MKILIHKIKQLLFVSKEIRSGKITNNDLWYYNNNWYYDYYGIQTLNRFEEKYFNKNI